MLLVGLPLHELAMPNALAEVAEEADLAIALVHGPDLHTFLLEVVLLELEDGLLPLARALVARRVLLAPRYRLKVRGAIGLTPCFTSERTNRRSLRLLRRCSSASKPFDCFGGA